MNPRHRMREVFEPFHPDFTPACRGLGHSAYRAPGVADPALAAFGRRVFSGAPIHPRADADTVVRRRFTGLLVKDVFAGFLAAWAVAQCPQVAPVLLVRNPFSVARSKRARPHWFWGTGAAGLLAQPDLMRDHLADQRARLTRIAGLGEGGSGLMDHLAVWAALHRVLGRQSLAGDIAPRVIFYEELQADPRGVVSAVWAALDLPVAGDPPDAETIERPSRVSRPRDLAAARSDPAGAWRADLSPDELAEGRDILADFGLAGLYGDDGRAGRAEAGRLFGASALVTSVADGR